MCRTEYPRRNQLAAVRSGVVRYVGTFEGIWLCDSIFRNAADSRVQVSMKSSLMRLDWIEEKASLRLEQC